MGLLGATLNDSLADEGGGINVWVEFEQGRF